VADLMNVQEEGVAVFPVLINPTSRRRMIATDEIIVQFSTGIGGPRAEKGSVLDILTHQRGCRSVSGRCRANSELKEVSDEVTSSKF
jgi:hypothetical protein